MRILVVDQDGVPRLLPVAECMKVMAGALRALSAGHTLLPLRTLLMLPGGAAPAGTSTPRDSSGSCRGFAMTWGVWCGAPDAPRGA